MAGTPGSGDLLHLDSRGDCSFVIVVAGIELRIVVEPLDSGSLSLFQTFDHVEVGNVDWSKWKVEGVILNAGDLWHVVPHFDR